MKDVSALMDGELERKRVRATINRLEGQDELRNAWATFHVIRDALQGNAVGSSRFIEKFHQRLEQEPLSVVPRWRVRLPVLRTMWVMALGALLVASAIAWLASGSMGPAGSGEGSRPASFVDVGLNDSVAIEYAMAHRQLVPAFVSGSAGQVGAVAVPDTTPAAAGRTAGAAR